MLVFVFVCVSFVTAYKDMIPGQGQIPGCRLVVSADADETGCFQGRRLGLMFSPGLFLCCVVVALWSLIR